MPWTLNGQTLDTLDAVSVTLTRIARGDDTLRIRLIRPDATTPAPWTTGTNLTLSGNGDTWTGEITHITPVITPTAEYLDITAYGPWYFLARQTYLQNRLVPTFPGSPLIEPANPPDLTPSVTLFQDNNADRSTTNAQIADALAQTTRLTLDSTLPDADPIPQTATSITLRDVIDRALRYHPAAIAWTDGTILRIRPATSLPTISLAPTDWTITATPRPDLHLNGVRIRYTNPAGGGGDTIDSAPISVDPTAERVLNLIYDLDEKYTAPTGLAAIILDDLDTTPWDITATRTDQEVEIAAHLGHRVTLTGGLSGSAPIQTVTYDILTGRTTLRAAPLPVNRLEDLIELLRLREHTTGGRGSSQPTTTPIEDPIPSRGLQFYRTDGDTVKITHGTIAGQTPGGLDNDYTPGDDQWAYVTATLDAAGLVQSISGISISNNLPDDTDSTHTIPLAHFTKIPNPDTPLDQILAPPANQVDGSVQIISCGIEGTHYHY